MVLAFRSTLSSSPLLPARKIMPKTVETYFICIHERHSFEFVCFSEKATGAGCTAATVSGETSCDVHISFAPEGRSVAATGAQQHRRVPK
jgi:hypothetical protein